MESFSSTQSRLATPIQFVKGVGPERAELLGKLNLRTAADILFNFPRTYQDMSAVRLIADLEQGVAVTICGVVEEIDKRTTINGKTIVGALVRDESDYVRATWYNQPYVDLQLHRGRPIMLSGTARLAGLRWEMVHPRIKRLDEISPIQKGEVLPVYGLTEGLKQSHLRRITAGVLDEYLLLVEETLPEELRRDHHLLPVQRGLSQIHFPQDDIALDKARRRFIFQELLVLQLALAIRRRQLAHLVQADALETTTRIDARIRRLFSFELTAGQRAAIAEVAADMNRTVPMNRLLQGDVGSGKTVVAVYAMLVAVAHGYQAALMAPTEVLARQHYETMTRTLAAARVRVALWTGGMSTDERRQTKEKIEAGDVDLVVGTQALIHSDYQFAKLGLVIIDEQHKFGVAQRARLRQTGAAPHYLVMTATPIPRTVAMTAYGDLDVSSLRDHPPGRQPVHAYLVPDEKRANWWEFFRQQLISGRQGFVITPRLIESDDEEVSSLQQSYETLANGELEEFRLDIVHGRMSADEKQLAMDMFRRGDTQVLLATTVVEVGVDIPNASIMTIENAERFGLAQLHQLRGRVGRGLHAGYVGLFSAVEDPSKLERLDLFRRTNDGFELAEIDFQMRGPGDLMGTRQHGLPSFRIADLARDHAILREARDVAQSLVESEKLKLESYARLRQQVFRRYGETYQLGDVG